MDWPSTNYEGFLGLQIYTEEKGIFPALWVHYSALTVLRAIKGFAHKEVCEVYVAGEWHMVRYSVSDLLECISFLHDRGRKAARLGEPDKGPFTPSYGE